MIRTDPQTPNPFVPVIMLTGHTHIDQVRQARDAGVNEFIAKPVSVKTMMQRLVSVIESPRPYVRTKVYFGPCRRRRGADEYRGPERRDRRSGRAGGGIGDEHGPRTTDRTVHAAQHAEGEGRRRRFFRPGHGRDQARRSGDGRR